MRGGGPKVLEPLEAGRRAAERDDDVTPTQPLDLVLVLALGDVPDPAGAAREPGGGAGFGPAREPRARGRSEVPCDAVASMGDAGAAEEGALGEAAGAVGGGRAIEIEAGVGDAGELAVAEDLGPERVVKRVEEVVPVVGPLAEQQQQLTLVLLPVCVRPLVSQSLRHRVELVRMSGDSGLGLGGLMLEWGSPGEEGVVPLGSAAGSCKEVRSDRFLT
ncbi:hypothetical protein B296_00001348 [Ensete ventricosum]|uniref:Uncharacterized protein n=1 Tax=Ensete ventricosum TaxID=4639 RepID=A0A426Z3H7_ENSVE|nr:hypothetical protein B296_00001348 [Ensete ventricosum]